MQQYEYKVVPAPIKGERARGVKSVPDRFAHTLTTLMNQMAVEGWEYLRAETLPCEERSGLTGRTRNFQNMLVFRRTIRPVTATDDAAPDTAAPATPEEFASAAAASLTVAGAEGTPPEIGDARSASGAAPAIGPARKDKDDPRAG